MNKNEDAITVYWAPSNFTVLDESWELAYSEPKSILTKFLKQAAPGASMAMCPATKSLLRNTYSLNSRLEDSFEIELGGFKNLNEMPINFELGKNTIAFYKIRESSFPGYVNVSYNLGWLFFSSEPVDIKLTAPFFPSSDICPGSIFSPGKMNIGKWYRPLNVDWHIPSDTKKISIKEGQELAYIEFVTDKKIIFKRYQLTPRLLSLSNEAVASPNRYGTNLPLIKRYEMAKNAKLSKMVLAEIQKNLL